MYYCRIVFILLGDLLQLSQDGVITKEMWHAYHNSHSEGISMFQVESLVGANCMVGVEPYRLSARHIGQVVLGSFYVLYGIVVDLEVCLDI